MQILLQILQFPRYSGFPTRNWSSHKLLKGKMGYKMGKIRWYNDDVVNTGADLAQLWTKIFSKFFKIHLCITSMSILRYWVLEIKLKRSGLILTMDFSKNCCNEKFHEIQNAYFNKKTVTLYIRSCHYESGINNSRSYDDKNSWLKFFATITVL